MWFDDRDIATAAWNWNSWLRRPSTTQEATTPSACEVPAPTHTTDLHELDAKQTEYVGFLVCQALEKLRTLINGQ